MKEGKEFLYVGDIVHWKAIFTIIFLLYAALIDMSEARAQVRRIQIDDRPTAAKSGTRTRLTFYYAINSRDCSTRKGFSVTIPDQPSNGTIELHKTNQLFTSGMLHSSKLRSSARRGQALEKCLGNNIDVISLYYTSKPGFKGVEKFSVIFISSNQERERRQTWRVFVQ